MDFLNVGSNQRIDQDDLQYAVSMSQINASRIATASILTSGGNWVVNGFQTSNPSGTKTVLVQGGTAILSWRTGAVIVHGMVIAPPDGTGGTAQQVSQTLDLSSYAAGTYGVYIRFNLTSTAYQGRTFWTTATVGSEQSKSTATRQQAVWETRVEVNNPGAEWVQIAQVVVGSGGSVTSVTDTRPMFYEGAGASPAYPNTWGTTSDRNANRATYGIGDLKTFVDAVRTCLEDIKGPGVARWYSPYVAGMNIGDGSGFSSNTVTANRVCLGDSGFYLDCNFGTNGYRWPVISFDSSGINYMRFVRTSSPSTGALQVALAGGFNITAQGQVTINGTPCVMQTLNSSYFTQCYSYHSGGIVYAMYQGYQATPPSARAQLVAVASNAAWMEFCGSAGGVLYGQVGQITTTQFGLAYGSTPVLWWDSAKGAIAYKNAVQGTTAAGSTARHYPDSTIYAAGTITSGGTVVNKTGDGWGVITTANWNGGQCLISVSSSLSLPANPVIVVTPQQANAGTYYVTRLNGTQFYVTFSGGAAVNFAIVMLWAGG